MEDVYEEAGGYVGAEDDAFRPGGREAGVAIGMEVREEERGGEIGGGREAKSAYEEAGVWDEFGRTESGGNGMERTGEIGCRGMGREGVESREIKAAGV